MSTAPAVPVLPAGTVLQVEPGDVRYGQAPAGLPALVVACVRVELARFYGGQWVWVSGHAGCAAQPPHPPCIEVLLATRALRRAKISTSNA